MILVAYLITSTTTLTCTWPLNHGLHRTCATLMQLTTTKGLVSLNATKAYVTDNDTLKITTWHIFSQRMQVTAKVVIQKYDFH